MPAYCSIFALRSALTRTRKLSGESAILIPLQLHGLLEAAPGTHAYPCLRANIRSESDKRYQTEKSLTQTMSRQDTLVKCFLFFGFCILLVDKVLLILRNQASPRALELDQNEGNAIRNSAPHSGRQAATRWNLTSMRGAFLLWANLTNPITRGTSPFVNVVSTWFDRILLPFKKHRNSAERIPSDPSQPGLEVAFEQHVSDSKRAYYTSQINGIDIAYHNPLPVKKVRGVALLIHGCQQEASDWFQLPEHRHIAAQLIRKRLALLAVTSANRVTGCWSTRFPHWQNDDVERVVIATRQWIADNGIPPQMPLYAVGISSGATMLSVLSSSNKLPYLASQALYISPGNQRALRNASNTYPNTLFVHITTDHHYASPSAIAAARKTLLKQNVGLVGELPLSKVQLTPLTLHEREPRITPEMSRKIYAAAQQVRGDMERAIRMSMDEGIVALWTKRDSRRAVRQVFRVVNGLHEVSAKYADKVTNWLVSNGRRTKSNPVW